MTGMSGKSQKAVPERQPFFLPIVKLFFNHEVYARRVDNNFHCPGIMSNGGIGFR